jgi:hypothetical protein
MKVSKCLLYLLPFFSLFGCSNQGEIKVNEPVDVVEINHSYDEVREYELLWETMFDVDSPQYYVYIYSITCNHCEELKIYIIEKALTNKNIYFIKGSNKDQIGNDPNSSKFAENPGDIWILGYPSLLQITDHKCTKNLAGTVQIKGELK